MKVHAIVMHAAATRPDQHITAADVRRWHVEGNGWSDIGYHYFIRRDGTVEKGRPDGRQGAHVAGHNAGTLGVCMAGGFGGDCNYTAAQWDAAAGLVRSLIVQHPDAKVTGHRDLDSGKQCPCFDAEAWAETLTREGAV